MSKKPAGRPRELNQAVQLNLCVEADTKTRLEELTSVAKQDDPKASLSRVAATLIDEKHEEIFGTTEPA